MFKQSIINTLAQIGGKGVMVVLALVTTAWLTRSLGAEVYGKLTLIGAIFLLLDAVADFGIKIIGVRELAAVDKEADKEKIFSQIVFLRWIITGIAFGIGLVLIWTLPTLATMKLAAILSLSMIWLTSTAGSLEILFQARMRLGNKVIMDVLFPLLFLMILGLVRDRVELVGVMIIYLVARTVSLGYGLVAAKIKNFKWSLDKTRIKQLIRESWPMGVYIIIFTAYDRAVDSLMISRLLGVKEVAWYGLAYKVYINLLQPAYFFVNSVFPLLSVKTGSKRILFNRSFLVLIAGVAIVIPTIYGLAPWIVSVLAGSGFEPAAGVLRTLVWAVLFSYLGHLFGFTLISRNGQKKMLPIGITILIFNILMNWWLIPKMGVTGAAWVTVMTEALGCGLMGFYLLKSVHKN